MKKLPSAQHPSLPHLYPVPNSTGNMGSDWSSTPSSAVLIFPFRALCDTWTLSPTQDFRTSWLTRHHLRKPPSCPQTFPLSDAFFCLSSCPVTSGSSTHLFYLLLLLFSVTHSIFKSKGNLIMLTNGRASTTNAILKKRKLIYDEVKLHSKINPTPPLSISRIPL